MSEDATTLLDSVERWSDPLHATDQHPTLTSNVSVVQNRLLAAGFG